MPGIEDLLRRRSELLEEIDREILKSHTRDVTLLFTDIVGSTRFYERHGDIAGRQMVQAHNDLLFPIIAAHAGRVIKTIGDSIMAVFDDPVQAVTCAVAMQRAIETHDASASEAMRFQVRMGLHHGTAVVDERDVFGDVVNTAARVESRADGAQIIISGIVKARATACGVPLVFLGTEKVKGRDQPVELFLVDWNSRGEQAVLADWRGRQAGAPGAEAGAVAGAPAGPPPPRVTLGPAPDLRAETERLAPLPDRGNPYLNRVMIPHPGMFVGRRALVRRIMGRLSGSRPQSLSIVGERRIGKSSLLNFLRSPVGRAMGLQAPESCLFVLADFQQARAIAPEKVLSLIFRELRRQAGMTIEGEEDYDALRRVADAVAERSFRLVLLLDEFETVTRNAAVGPDFYSFLRSLANSLPLSFICASGRNLKDLCATREISDSPFFNIFSIVHLGPLEQADAEALVRDPSTARGVPLAPVLANIMAMGGRLPFFLQIACSAWFEYLEGEGKAADDLAGKSTPAAVTDMFREEAYPHFEYVVETLPEAELQVLRASAAGTPPGPEDPGAQALERKGYLETREGKHVPFSEEFARFVRQGAGR
jgi:class 3 adenylate cyclase